MLHWRRPITALMKSSYSIVVRHILETNQFYTRKNTEFDIIVIALLYFKLTVFLVFHIGIYFSKIYYILQWASILMKPSLLKYLAI